MAPMCAKKMAVLLVLLFALMTNCALCFVDDDHGKMVDVVDAKRSLRSTVSNNQDHIQFAGINSIESSTMATSGTTRKNAYGTMLYMGTPRDYEFYIAARVLMQSLARLNVDADLVVIASLDVPYSWVQTFTSEGVKVVRVPNIPNPYWNRAYFNPRFKFSLNKMYAWRLLDYERVIMLDVDNVFLRKPDELFLCGQFCAAFIDPCIFHTGLFVLEPSEKVFKDMYKFLSKGKDNIDGADQGFLTDYFGDLLEKPLFKPPTNNTRLNGHYRLPLGYQMDASYYYIRLLWRVPCGANTVITFPSASWLKPWYWWSWPVLPLGLSWHEERLATIGYSSESHTLLAECFLYCAILVMAIAVWAGFIPFVGYRSCVPKDLWLRHESLCVLFFTRILPPSLIITSFFLPMWMVPTTSHPMAGWGTSLFGSLSILVAATILLKLDWLPMFTPWMVCSLSLFVMAFPYYTNGIVRMLAVFGYACFSTPFFWWSLRTVSTPNVRLDANKRSCED